MSAELTERRRIILAAAEKLLEHYGLSKTTVADIARAAEIGVGTVYLEFGSKDDIIGHVAQSKHDIVLDKLRKAASVDGDTSTRLRSVLDTRVRVFRQIAKCGTHAPDVLHCRCGPVQKSWSEYCEAERELVVELLREGAEAGELRFDDAAVTAQAMLDAYAIFGPPWSGRVSDDRFGDRLDAVHDLVLRGVQR